MAAQTGRARLWGLGSVVALCLAFAGQAQAAEGAARADAVDADAAEAEADGATAEAGKEKSEETAEEAKLSAKAERRARDPLFRADLDVSFTYGKVHPIDTPHIFGGSLHTRFGLRAWSVAKVAGRIDIGVYTGYRVAPYPSAHDELGQFVKQIGNGHRGFIWGSLGHSFYFTKERRVALGVHGMMGWSHYFLHYTIDDQVSGVVHALRQRHNALSYAVHGHFAVAFGPRAGMIFSGTYTIPTDPNIAPWSAAIGLNVKLN